MFLATRGRAHAPFLQYVATMAAVDAIQDCADEALAEAAAAHDERSCSAGARENRWTCA